MVPAEAILAERPQLLRYAKRLCKNAHDAEDLAQDAIERALRYCPDLASTSDLRALLWTICKRQWLKSISRNGGIPLAAVDLDAESRELDDDETDRGSSWTPPAQYFRTLLSETVAAMATLPAIHQQVLQADALGYTHKEMAALLGVRTGTTQSRLSRAREAMAGLMPG